MHTSIYSTSSYYCINVQYKYLRIAVMALASTCTPVQQPGLVGVADTAVVDDSMTAKYTQYTVIML